jgi:hypothetical protein
LIIETVRTDIQKRITRTHGRVSHLMVREYGNAAPHKTALGSAKEDI